MNKKYFTVDGRTVDYETLAGELGITVCALHVAASKYRDRSMQEIADMYRNGRIRSRVHGAHCVHGRWLTIAEAAAELGLAEKTLRAYHWKWQAKTLEETVDRVIWQQQCPGKRGKRARRHRVRGKLMTVAEAAEKLGVTDVALYNRIRRGESLEQAVDGVERTKREKAKWKIIRILGGENG